VIPYGRQRIDKFDVEAVTEALLSDFVTQGPRVVSFENALAIEVGAKHAVAVNSATSALHLACLAVGIGPGDLVWTSAVSFVATSNAVLYCGAEVDFVDIETSSVNISAEALRVKLKSASALGARLPKALIVVHMTGQPCDMADIHELSKEFGFKIIEDASHALGSTFRGDPTGSCKFSDITVFSFHAVKMITTGEGGACVTNDDALASKIQRLRSHGITRDPNEIEAEYPGAWYYEQLELGFNYRMTDFQAALGESQLSKLSSFVLERNKVADWYDKNLKELNLELPQVSTDKTSSFHLYVVLTSDSGERKATFERMRSEGILVNVHYLPIYQHPYYKSIGKYLPEDFPNSENYYSRCLSLPVFPGISDEELLRVRDALGSKLGFQTIF
jgi:UDP-4-amino-4,6-dideoxy-N-acetyl-beta-L-altrosamine transaminase